MSSSAQLPIPTKFAASESSHGLAGKPSRRLWPALLALFLLVLGARLWLIWTYGSAMPYWDQWPGEGLLVLKPWQEGKLTWAAMFASHLEHRIFFTRALAIGLFQINGQWDVQLETTCNAILCSSLVAAIAAALLRTFPTRLGWRAGILLGLGLLFSLPFGWENTLGGFQSGFYFLLVFSLLALWGLGSRRPFSPGWWLGALAAVAACFNMASGFFAAAIVLGWLLLCGLKRCRWPGGSPQGAWATALICIGVLALGWALRTEVPGHAVLKAGSPAAWVVALGRCLAWPRTLQPGWAVAMQAPLVLLAMLYLFRSRLAGQPSNAAEEFILLLGGWVLLQAAAMAYARGGPAIVAPRYMDLLAVGALANGLAAWLLATRAPTGTWRRPAALLAAALWTTACLTGLAKLSLYDFHVQLPEKRATLRTEEAHVRAFVLTGDLKMLPAQPLEAIPYPVPEHLASYLNDATLRAALPAVVRAPLTLEPESVAAPSEGGFSSAGLPPEMLRGSAPSDPPAWGSYGEHGAKDKGRLHARLQPAVRLPYLQWQFAGDLDGNDAALALRLGAAGDSDPLRAFHPSRVAGGHWRTEFLPAPAADLRLEAEDNITTGWFAFRAPVEVGRWSYWTGWLLRRGGWVFSLGALGLILAILPRPKSAKLFS